MTADFEMLRRHRVESTPDINCAISTSHFYIKFSISQHVEAVTACSAVNILGHPINNRERDTERAWMHDLWWNKDIRVDGCLKIENLSSKVRQSKACDSWGVWAEDANGCWRPPGHCLGTSRLHQLDWLIPSLCTTNTSGSR